MKYLLILALLRAVLSVEFDIANCTTKFYPEIIKKAIKTSCLEDSRPPGRLLPNYTLTARQKDLVKVEYVGPIDWGIGYVKFLPDFICKCAVKALEWKHRFFGIQFFGECWSANKISKPKKKVTDCVDGTFAKCKKKDKFCTGKHWVNQVYAFKKKWFKKHKGETLDCKCQTPDEPTCPETPEYLKHVSLESCLKDYPNRRLLPKYALTAREVGLDNVPYVGPINWGSNYTKFLKIFICKCAERAFELNHKFFGIQFFGECWSANETGTPQIPVTDCVNGTFQKCKLTEDKYCTGKHWVNAVYKLDYQWFEDNKGKNFECECPDTRPVVCPENIHLESCLKDRGDNRLLPKYALTARERLVNVPYVGPIDWGIAYATFLPDFICKCAERACNLKHRFFGIQFFGECWSANVTGTPQISVDNCVNGNFEPCKLDTDTYCTGRRWANAVYKFKNDWFDDNC